MSSSTLVIALASMNRCAEAKPLIRPTLEAHEILFTEFDFMMPAAYCYLAAGDVMTAAQALLALQATLPEAKAEPKFQQMAEIILDAKASSQKNR